MKRLFILLFVYFLCINCKKEQTNITFTSSNFELLELSEGVYACIHKFGGTAICNAGIIDNGTETIIFDSFLSPDAAEELKKIVDTFNLSPIKYVINSHSHNDHIRGNQVFGDGVKIISTTKTAELIKKWEPMDIADEKEYAHLEFAHYDSLYNNFSGDKTSREFQKILMWRPYYKTLDESHEKVVTTPPNTFFEDSMSLDGSAFPVKLISLGPGHTESDVVLHLPQQNIVFTGDLVFNVCHPYMGNGNINGLKIWLDHISSLNPETVIPGHGDLGDSATILDMKSYVSNLETIADSLHQAKANATAAYHVNIPEKYKHWWFDMFFPPNVRFAFNSVDENDMEKVAEKLRLDSNHTFLKTLQPTYEDCKAIFKTEEAAKKAFEYSQNKWKGINEVSDDSMKPLTNNATLKIIKVRAVYLQYNITMDLPGEYTVLGQHLNDHFVVYGLQYLNDDGTIQKTRSAFFKLPDKWVLIPLAYKAFEEES
ncbi:MAG: MBL fold metallo-hydrolase [Flavobacteriaceae bacterium]